MEPSINKAQELTFAQVGKLFEQLSQKFEPNRKMLEERLPLDKKAILLLGDSGVTKTTTIATLDGQPLTIVENQFTGQPVVHNSGLSSSLKIGSGISAETEFPNFVELGNEMAVDCQGFKERRSSEQMLANVFCLNSLSSLMNKFKILWLISGKSVVEPSSLVDTLTHFIKTVGIDNMLTNKDSFVMIFTKAHESKIFNTIKTIFKNAQMIDEITKQKFFVFLQYIESKNRFVFFPPAEFGIDEQAFFEDYRVKVTRQLEAIKYGEFTPFNVILDNNLVNNFHSLKAIALQHTEEAIRELNRDLEEHANAENFEEAATLTMATEFFMNIIDSIFNTKLRSRIDKKAMELFFEEAVRKGGVWVSLAHIIKKVYDISQVLWHIIKTLNLEDVVKNMFKALVAKARSLIDKLKAAIARVWEITLDLSHDFFASDRSPAVKGGVVGGMTVGAGAVVAGLCSGNPVVAVAGGFIFLVSFGGMLFMGFISKKKNREECVRLVGQLSASMSSLTFREPITQAL